MGRGDAERRAIIGQSPGPVNSRERRRKNRGPAAGDAFTAATRPRICAALQTEAEWLTHLSTVAPRRDRAFAFGNEAIGFRYPVGGEIENVFLV